MVRGICCLRPGLPGISENIEVISVVGRFLEHSRIYQFQNGGEEQVYIGSADLMSRNIDHRVETLIPIRDARMVWHITTGILGPYLADQVKVRRMLPNGTYRRKREGRSHKADAQSYLMQTRKTAAEPQRHAHPKPRLPLKGD